MSKKVLVLLVVVWVAALGLVGFSELRPGDAENSAGRSQQSEQEGSASTGSPESAEAGEQPVSREPTTRENPEPGSGAGGVILEIGGEPGLGFSGSCTVDGEKRELEGRTPETYAYEPEERLGCEISSRSRGPLRVDFSSGSGTSSTQRVGPGPTSLELTYTGNGLSTSVSSGTSGSQSGSARSFRSSQSSQSVQSSQSGSPVTRSGPE